METYGKGKAYTRVEPIHADLSIPQLRASFEQLFQEFSSHIIPSWFLTNTKLELQKCCSSRATTLFITTDFAENVVVVRKYEVSDQYFHRVEILLWGAVASYVVTRSDGELVLIQESYMVSSDYRCTFFILFEFPTPPQD